MSTLFGQLSGTPREPPSEPLPKGRAGPAPSGAATQLELGLSGLAPDPLRVAAPRSARARRPAPAPADAETAFAELRTERASERAADLQAQSDLRALKADAEARSRRAEAASAARHALDTRRIAQAAGRPPAPGDTQETPPAPPPATSYSRPAIVDVPVSRLQTPRPVLRRVGVAAALLLAIGLGTWLFGRRLDRPAPERRTESNPPPPLAPAPGATLAGVYRAPAADMTRPAAGPASAPRPREEPAPARAAARPAIALPGLRVRPDGDGLLIVFDEGLFERHAQLSEDARVLLKQLAAQLGPALPGWRLVITGHTDPSPVRSAHFADNRDLGLQRARAVAAYLASECGLPAGALAAGSNGETQTPYPNTTPDLRRKNRTVTIRVSPR